jgi:soluble lytic murein transglycosylase-like protein
MKAIYALIPAALLVGTVLSGPVEARGTADAWRSISKQDYFTVMSAKKVGKVNKVGNLKARKKAATASKSTKNILKKTTLKPSKKPAKFSMAGKKPKIASVVASKLDEIKPHEISATTLNQGEAKPHDISVADLNRDEVKPHDISIVVSEEGEIEPREISIVSLEQDEITPNEISVMASEDEIKANEISVASLNQDEIKPREISAAVPEQDETTPNEIALGEALPPSVADEVRIADIIREMAPSYGVPTWFALRIAEVESNYDPYARGRAGEIGIYQLKCKTARVLGFEGDCSDLTDARTNVHWGLKHLARAIALSNGNLRLAASKHNAGLSHKSLVRSYIAKVF